MFERSNACLQRTTGANYPPPPNPNQQNYFARNHKPRGLPPPHELAQRIEEARTSSKLLLQVVQSTPPAELIGNELVKEFVERCQSASRSVQGYIDSDNPPPDEDTLLTLIETNDQLATAISRHQHALLQARRSTGAAPLAPTGGLFEAPGSQPSGAPVSKTFIPAPELPPRRNHPGQTQDPFDDGRGSDQPREDSMQAPLEPQHYGTSASHGRPNGSQAATAYHTDFQPMTPYDDRQDYAVNHQTMHGATATHEPVSPEIGRRPVQYRF